MISFWSTLWLLSTISCFFWMQTYFHEGFVDVNLASDRIIKSTEHLSFQRKPNLDDDQDLHEDHDKPKEKPKPNPNVTVEEPHKEPEKEDHHEVHNNHTIPSKNSTNHSKPGVKPINNVIKSLNCQGDCNGFTSNEVILRLRRKHIIQIHGTSAFLEVGGIVPRKNTIQTMLCKLNTGGHHSHCVETYISEITDLVYSFQPVYSTRQDAQPMMYHHHTNFKGYMKSYGFQVITIEGIYKQLGQTFRATVAGREPEEIQLHLYDKIFMRENLLNVAARKVKGWEYMLWIDAHQIFLNKYWWEDAIYKMEHYNSVQFFQTLAHQLQDQNITDWRLDFPGTIYIYSHTRPLQAHRDRLHVWIGNAFGIRKELYQEIDFIMDYCISGCCDCAYNMASFKNWDSWDIFGAWPRYIDVFRPWVDKTRKIFNQKTTFVRGHMLHLWHERFFHFEEMLRAVGYTRFDPEVDIKRDENFTLYLVNQYWKDLFATNG